jgi:hypothetical protein
MMIEGSGSGSRVGSGSIPDQDLGGQKTRGPDLDPEHLKIYLNYVISKKKYDFSSFFLYDDRRIRIHTSD